MASTLGSAYVQIVPSAKGISGSIQQVLSPEAKTAGKTAGRTVASFAKVAIVAAGIGKAFAAAITEGGALEQSLGGVETLFKDSADTVIQYADNAYKTAGLSANEYMETATGFAASLLQSLGGDTQAAAKYTDMAITDMSDNANKMGTDMELIQYAYQGFAKQNYTMLDNLKLGYGGTKSEMERLLADAEKLSGQEYDISNLSDVYEAIHVIQENLDITGTTSREAATTLVGSFSSMKSAAQNFMGNLTLGRNIGPSMAALAETASTFLFGNLLPAVGRIFMSLPAAIVSFVQTGLPQIVTAGQEMIQNLITGLKQKMQNMPAEGGISVVNFITGLVSKIPSLITNGGKLIVKLLGAIDNYLPQLLQKGGVLIGKLALGILKSLPKILASMGKVTLKITGSIIKLIPKLLSGGVKLISGLAKGLGGGVIAKVKAAMRKAKNAITEPINNAKESIRQAINRIKGFFNITLKFKGINLPHIDVSWKKGGNLAKIASKLGLPGVPDFNVSWYKTGGIFNQPSIVGLAEAGSEAVVPLNQLWNRFDMMADSIVNGVNSVLGGIGSGSTGEIVIQVYLFPSGPKMGEYVVKTYDTYKRRLG